MKKRLKVSASVSTNIAVAICGVLIGFVICIYFAEFELFAIDKPKVTDWVQAISSFVGVAVSGLVAVLVFKTLQASQHTVAVTQEALEAQKLQTRAWVIVESVEVRFSADIPIRVTITAKNYGNTIARKVRIKATFRKANTFEPLEIGLIFTSLFSPPSEPSFTLAPGQSATLEIDDPQISTDHLTPTSLLCAITYNTVLQEGECVENQTFIAKRKGNSIIFVQYPSDRFYNPTPKKAR